MKRIGKYFNTDCGIAVYKSFTSSNFSYCPVPWMLGGKRNSDELENCRRGVSVLYSLSPYKELLKHGNCLSLSALRISYLAIEMYKCVHGRKPPYLNELFKSKDTRFNFRYSNRIQQPKFLCHFVIMVQNRGTPSQQRLRSPKFYTTLRKLLLNGVHRLNVMCSSYNDIHDIYIYERKFITLLSVLSAALFIIQLHVSFIEAFRFIC